MKIKKTTVKRISVGLTKTDANELHDLSIFFNETYTDVIKRAIMLLHYIYMLHPELVSALSQNACDNK